MRISREQYLALHVPPAAMKVADKQSDAVAYLYQRDNTPCAAVFFGKQSKPVAHFKYNSAAHRERRVTEAFNNRRAVQEYKAKQHSERHGKARNIEVGSFFYTSWGYDQTNIDFYQVVELVGAKSARVRQVGSLQCGSPDAPWMTGKAIPEPDAFKGPPVLVRVTGDRFSVDGHYANPWKGQPVNWTAYA